MKRITAVLLCICLMLCGLTVFSQENEATVEFLVAEADGEGYVNISLTVKNASFQVIQATVTYNPGQFTADEKEISDLKLGIPAGETETELLSSVKTELDSEKGFVKIVAMTDMSYKGDKYTDDSRNVVADDKGIEVFSFKIKKNGDGDYGIDIKDVALASNGEELPFKTAKKLPGKEEVVETFVPVEPEIQKSEQELRQERMKDSLILQINNYAAVDDGELCWIDSENKSVAPYIKNSRTMVPLRFVAERVGLTVSWEEETRTIVMTGSGTELIMQIGNDEYKKNGESLKMDAAAELTDAGRTFVPLRVIAEAFGQDVTWVSNQNCVIIVPLEKPWDEANRTEQRLLQDALLIMSPLIRDLV